MSCMCDFRPLQKEQESYFISGLKILDSILLPMCENRRDAKNGDLVYIYNNGLVVSYNYPYTPAWFKKTDNYLGLHFEWGFRFPDENKTHGEDEEWSKEIFIKNVKERRVGIVNYYEYYDRNYILQRLDFTKFDVVPPKVDRAENTPFMGHISLIIEEENK